MIKRVYRFTGYIKLALNIKKYLNCTIKEAIKLSDQNFDNPLYWLKIATYRGKQNVNK